MGISNPTKSTPTFQKIESPLVHLTNEWALTTLLLSSKKWKQPPIRTVHSSFSLPLPLFHFFHFTPPLRFPSRLSVSLSPLFFTIFNLPSLPTVHHLLLTLPLFPILPTSFTDSLPFTLPFPRVHRKGTEQRWLRRGSLTATVVVRAATGQRVQNKAVAGGAAREWRGCSGGSGSGRWWCTAELSTGDGGTAVLRREARRRSVTGRWRTISEVVVQGERWISEGDGVGGRTTMAGHRRCCVQKEEVARWWHVTSKQGNDEREAEVTTGGNGDVR